MTEYTLSSEAERKLYVEAIFHCLDRHMITEYDACRDMKTILLSLTSIQFSLADERALIRRLTGVLRAYASGTLSQPAACANFEGLLEAAVRDDVAFFTQARVMNDA